MELEAYRIDGAAAYLQALDLLLELSAVAKCASAEVSAVFGHGVAALRRFAVDDVVERRRPSRHPAVLLQLLSGIQSVALTREEATKGTLGEDENDVAEDVLRLEHERVASGLDVSEVVLHDATIVDDGVGGALGALAELAHSAFSLAWPWRKTRSSTPPRSSAQSWPSKSDIRTEPSVV